MQGDEVEIEVYDDDNEKHIVKESVGFSKEVKGQK